MTIAVFGASSDTVNELFFEDAAKLGEEIGKRDWDVIYGGTQIGLMYHVAMNARKFGSRIIGVIPECIKRHGVAAKELDELIVTSDMKERKQMMRECADAFVALPGGWGTLEEVSEVVTLKQLGCHFKPIVFLNTNGFYDGFLTFLANIQKQGFISKMYDDLYYVAETVEETLEYIANDHSKGWKSKY